MASLCQEVLRWILSHMVIFQGVATNCLDVKLLQSTLKELIRNAIISVQLLWQIKNSLGAQIEQRPGVHIPEQPFFENLVFLVPEGDFECIANKLQLSLLDGLSEGQGVELQVSRWLGSVLNYEDYRREIRTNPYGFQIGNCTITGDMTPSQWLVFFPLISVVSKQVAKLSSSLQFGNSGQGTGLQSNVVWIVQHGHEVSQQSGYGQICTHVGLIPWGPERNRVLPQKL